MGELLRLLQLINQMSGCGIACLALIAVILSLLIVMKRQ